MSKNEKKPSKISPSDALRLKQQYTTSDDGDEWKRMSELSDRADKKQKVTPKYGNPTKKK
jgi:hypothetical protein